jgi:hypothetical protein
MCVRVSPSGDHVLVGLNCQPFVVAYPSSLTGSGVSPSTSSGTGTALATFTRGGGYVMLAGVNMEGTRSLYGYAFDGTFGSRIDYDMAPPSSVGIAEQRVELSWDNQYIAWVGSSERLAVYSTGLVVPSPAVIIPTAPILASNVTYTPTTSAHWASPVPSTVQEALDRLAAGFDTEHGPVP